LTSVRRLALLAGAVVFVDTMFYAVVTPLLPAYQEELGLSKAGAGILAGAYPAGTLIFALPSAWAAARYGVRPVVLLGLGLMGVSSAVFGWAESAWLLDTARFVQGVGGACSWAGAMSWLVALAPPARRGELIGAALGAAVGGSLFGPVVGALAAATSTQVIFSAVLVVAAALAVWALRTPVPPITPSAAGTRVGPALRRPAVLGGMWTVTLPALTFGCVAVLGPLRLDELGAGGAAIAATFLLASAAEATVSTITGRVSDRRGRLAPIRLGLGGGALVLLALAPAPGPALLLAALIILLSGVLGLIWAPAVASLSEATERAGVSVAFAFGFMNLAWAIGQTGGESGGAALADATSDAVPLLLAAALAAATLVLTRRVVTEAE
jgi:MFS family permease